MQVDIVTATPHPIDVISAAAGTCYGKRDVNPNRVRNCYKSGHMSVFEHASATFLVSGISRACSHQLVRHRVASYSQQSQRYCKVDVDSCDWFVVPPSMDNYIDFHASMGVYAASYQMALEAGAKPEDARYLLPEATKTEITVTMNCRELFHFLDLRQSQAAQWEIRDLASAMVDALGAYDRQWRELLDMRGDES